MFYAVYKVDRSDAHPSPLKIVRLLLEVQDGQILVPVAAWYHKAEPTFADCLALVRRHFWRARYLVNSAAEAESMQFPHEVLDLLIHSLPLAA
jgi:hypothetical protein